jgi:guanylate kinase
LRIRTQKPAALNRRLRERHSYSRNEAEERILDAVSETVSKREILIRKLIDLHAAERKVCPFAAAVCHINQKAVAKLPLEVGVPLLRISVRISQQR